MPITLEYLAEVRAVCEAATPPPWRRDETREEMSFGQHLAVVSGYYSDETPGICGDHSELWMLLECDADFIALSRAALPALLDEVERLRAEAAGPALARHQPCGCVICVCRDADRCHGCGGKSCGTEGCVFKDPLRRRVAYEEAHSYQQLLDEVERMREQLRLANIDAANSVAEAADAERRLALADAECKAGREAGKYGRNRTPAAQRAREAYATARETNENKEKP